MGEVITKILEKHGVALGYIFGSHARDTAGPLSDIDVAVAFPYSLSRDGQDEKIASLRNEIQKIFKTDYVDVINLNINNNPALRYSIIFEGKALLVADPNLKTFLEIKAVKDYEDTRHLRDVQSKIIRNKIYAA